MPPATPTTFNELVDLFLNLIYEFIIPFIFGVIFLFLTWKIFDAWVLNAGDATKVTEGKQYALTAVLVVVLMISAWGIVALLKETLGA